MYLGAEQGQPCQTDRLQPALLLDIGESIDMST